MKNHNHSNSGPLLRCSFSLELSKKIINIYTRNKMTWFLTISNNNLKSKFLLNRDSCNPYVLATCSCLKNEGQVGTLLSKIVYIDFKFQNNKPTYPSSFSFPWLFMVFCCASKACLPPLSQPIFVNKKMDVTVNRKVVYKINFEWQNLGPDSLFSQSHTPTLLALLPPNKTMN